MPATLQPEFVSQSEIESLLALVAESDETAGYERYEAAASPRHEFPPVSLLSSVEMRKLRMRHENFLQTLSSRLALHFRLECSLQLQRLETTSFEAFVEGLDNPTHLSLFKLEPLRGVSLLDIPLKMAMGLIDRELGGPGRPGEEVRELTRMEEKLLNRVVDIIIGEWCQEWKDMAALRPAQIRSESNGHFLQTHEPQAPMLVLGIEVRLATMVEKMHLAFPCHSLEPMLIKLNDEPENSDQSDQTPATKSQPWNAAFGDMGIKLTAELPDVEITVRQLGNLKPGDFIPVNAALASRIQVYLESQPKFVGNLGMAGEQMAVQISKLLKT